MANLLLVPGHSVAFSGLAQCGHAFGGHDPLNLIGPQFHRFAHLIQIVMVVVVVTRSAVRGVIKQEIA